MSITSLAIVAFISGLLLGLNPIMINAMNNFISSRIGHGVSNSRFTFMGFVLIVYIFIFSVFIGALVASLINNLSIDTLQSLTLASCLLTIIVGLVMIKGYFFKNTRIYLPKEVISKLHKVTIKRRGIINILYLASLIVFSLLIVFIAAVVCFSIAGIFIETNPIYWLIPFSLGFITPIYAVLALLSDSTKPSAINSWASNSKPIIQLYGGLTLISIAWLVLYLVSITEVF